MGIASPCIDLIHAFRCSTSRTLEGVETLRIRRKAKKRCVDAALVTRAVALPSWQFGLRWDRNSVPRNM